MKVINKVFVAAVVCLSLAGCGTRVERPGPPEGAAFQTPASVHGGARTDASSTSLPGGTASAPVVRSVQSPSGHLGSGAGNAAAGVAGTSTVASSTPKSRP